MSEDFGKCSQCEDRANYQFGDEPVCKPHFDMRLKEFQESLDDMDKKTFTSAWVFHMMLRLWTPEECREFYAMLSRRLDFSRVGALTISVGPATVKIWPNKAEGLKEANMGPILREIADILEAPEVPPKEAL